MSFLSENFVRAVYIYCSEGVMSILVGVMGVCIYMYVCVISI